MWAWWRCCPFKLASPGVLASGVRGFQVSARPPIAAVRTSPIFLTNHEGSRARRRAGGWGGVGDLPPTESFGFGIEMARKLIDVGLPMSRPLKPAILHAGPASCFDAASATARIGWYLIRNRTRRLANRRWPSSKRPPSWGLDGDGWGYRLAQSYIPRPSFVGYPKTQSRLTNQRRLWAIPPCRDGYSAQGLVI